jgi:hypothetical protein
VRCQDDHTPPSSAKWSYFHTFSVCLHGTCREIFYLFVKILIFYSLMLQVQRLGSMKKTFHILWTEERLRMFTKGLSARLVQSACFSFAIILGYETIKRMSIIEKYRDSIRW